MASSKINTPVVSAVVAAIVIPSVVYLSLNSSAKNNTNDAKRSDQGITMTTNQGDVPMSVAPEANTGMVLLPFVGAVLVFSSLHLFRAKAAKKN
jgi:hypothetical protein